MPLSWLIENESVPIYGGTCLQKIWGAKIPTKQTRKEPISKFLTLGIINYYQKSQHLKFQTLKIK